MLSDVSPGAIAIESCDGQTIGSCAFALKLGSMFKSKRVNPSIDTKSPMTELCGRKGLAIILVAGGNRLRRAR